MSQNFSDKVTEEENAYPKSIIEDDNYMIEDDFVLQKVPEEHRIEMTEEIENLLMITFRTFDENQSGKLTRLHRLQRVENPHQKHGLSEIKEGNPGDIQRNRQGWLLEHRL